MKLYGIYMKWRKIRRFPINGTLKDDGGKTPPYLFLEFIMDIYENLLIRACKKQKVSHYALRRVLSSRFLLDIDGVKDKDVTCFLIEIVQKYELADLNRFFNKYEELVSFNDDVVKLYPEKADDRKDFLLETAISIIRFSESSKFPGCRWPLLFRSK